MLVVVAILSFVAISLTSITRALTTSSLRLKNIQTAQAQAQAAVLEISKQIRMSELTNVPASSIIFNWRKENGKTYSEILITLNQATIESYFPNFKISDFKIVNTEGVDGFNRVTIVFNIIIKDSPEDITIPFQMTTSLRSYNLIP
jgi:hypothetical protein